MFNFSRSRLKASLSIVILICWLGVVTGMLGHPIAAYAQGLEPTATAQDTPVPETPEPQTDSDTQEPPTPLGNEPTPPLTDTPPTEDSSVSPAPASSEPDPQDTPSSVTTEPVQTATPIPGVRVLVKRSPELATDPSQEFATGLAVEELETPLQQLGYTLLLVPSDQVEAVLAALENAPGVISVELDGTVTAAGLTINDPYYGSQTSLGLVGYPAAWETTTGSAGVVIAILDTGLDLGHAEFSGRIVAGYDFVNDDSDPTDDSYSGHGTLVTGIAAATGNNGTDIAGVDWNAQIMPIKVLNQFGNGNYSDVAEGIIWAVDNGADVINLSLGGPTVPGPALQAAIDYANANGVIVVAASGNGNSDLYYPAQYATVIAVGAVDNDLDRVSYSNFGPGLDVVAPGEDILSTLPGGGYALVSGTSAASPQVAALAALIVSVMESPSPQAVLDVITSTALDLGDAGFDEEYGFGLIQADAAVLLVAPPKPGKPTATPEHEDEQQTQQLSPIPSYSSGAFIAQVASPSSAATETATESPESSLTATATTATGNYRAALQPTADTPPISIVETEQQRILPPFWIVIFFAASGAWMIFRKRRTG